MSGASGLKIITNSFFGNYFSTVLSLTIILYLFGFLGLISININRFVNYSKENIFFYIELKDDANEATVFSFQKKLEALPSTKPLSVSFISRDEATELLKENNFLSQEDISLFGQSLLPDMIKFNISSKYFTEYKSIIKEIQSEEFVEHVFFSESPVHFLSSGVHRLSVFLLVLMIFFIFVASTFITNSIKLLLLCNKDFLLTLHLSGATLEYISKPYLKHHLFKGFISSVFAIFFLWMTHYFLESETWTFLKFNIDVSFAFLSFLMLFTGLFLSWFCTKHSINRFLNKRAVNWF